MGIIRAIRVYIRVYYMGIMEKNMGTVIVRGSGFGLGGLGSRFGGLGVYGSSVSRGLWA